jgi:metal-responsive CopG/Arc/MetJ family transcriptional regulator
MNTRNKTKNISTPPVRIQVRLPDALLKELNQAILSENYGLKGRSKWVEEAICFLISLENFEDLVTLDETISTTLLHCSFTLSKNIRTLLDDALIKIFTKAKAEYRQNLSMSSIVRTAILQRLLRGTKIDCPPGGQSILALINNKFFNKKVIG